MLKELLPVFVEGISKLTFNNTYCSICDSLNTFPMFKN